MWMSVVTVWVMFLCYLGLNRPVWLVGLAKKFSLSSIEGTLGDPSIEKVVFCTGAWRTLTFVWLRRVARARVNRRSCGRALSCVRLTRVWAMVLLALVRLTLVSTLLSLRCSVSRCVVWLPDRLL